jgi:hypothetical protein
MAHGCVRAILMKFLSHQKKWEDDDNLDTSWRILETPLIFVAFISLNAMVLHSNGTMARRE